MQRAFQKKKKRRKERKTDRQTRTLFCSLCPAWQPFLKNLTVRAHARANARTKPLALVRQIIQIMTPEQVSANEINYEISLTKGRRRQTLSRTSVNFYNVTEAPKNNLMKPNADF